MTRAEALELRPGDLIEGRAGYARRTPWRLCVFRELDQMPRPYGWMILASYGCQEWVFLLSQVRVLRHR